MMLLQYLKNQKMLCHKLLQFICNRLLYHLFYNINSYRHLSPEKLFE